MKIKTIEKLQDQLDRDLAWRKKELINLKLLVRCTQNSMYCRMGLVMLSAHFEGFIRTVANYYVVFVACQKLPLKLINTNFAAIHFKHVIERDKETTKISSYTRKLDEIISQYFEEDFTVKYTINSPIIKTESNPSSKVFREILASIGLSYSSYETKNNFIDTDLLSNRHAIAHGEQTKISCEEFYLTFDTVFEIMESFKDQVIQAAQENRYLKIVR